MRHFAHWTPRYILARCRQLVDHRLRPADPWLTREAIYLLDRLLRPSDTVLEFGAGRSTPWFAARVSKVTSVESDEGWYARVSEKLNNNQISNVDLRYCPRDLSDDTRAGAYVQVIDEFATESLDLVLVDGIYRNYCALNAISKVKQGGMIVVDNVNWYLPSASFSPNSRSLTAGAYDAVWQKFANETADWRHVWTTDGVTDTLILFKTSSNHYLASCSA